LQVEWLVEQRERVAAERHPELHLVQPSLARAGYLRLDPQQAPAAQPERHLVLLSGERPGYLRLDRQQAPTPPLEGRPLGPSDQPVTAGRSRLDFLLGPTDLSLGHLARRSELSARQVFHPNPQPVH
jgi:hypothetical protein